jgi:hypothetical protein
MKRSLVLFSVVAATIAGGCGVPTTKPPSRFITTFSPEDAMKRSYVQTEGKERPTVSNTAASAGSTGLGITHRAISAELSLSESEESQFLSKFKTEVTDQLRKYGAKTTGDGAGNNNYYLEYSEGAIAGVVEMYGMRGAADSYRLVVLIAER